VSTFVNNGLVTDVGSTGTATFSPCRRYRYALTREIEKGTRRICTFIMLNPSTADAFTLDPTIRRCLGFAKREHCTALWVVNLFAWRATKPKDLEGVDDPYGPENEHFIRNAIRGAQLVIAAWGAFRPRSHGNAHNVPRTLAWSANRELMALKISNGNPSHPLYLKADSPLVVYSHCAHVFVGHDRQCVKCLHDCSPAGLAARDARAVSLDGQQTLHEALHPEAG